jgi:hypothetical protein
MDNPHYCSTGWSLYDELGEIHMNFDKSAVFDEKHYAGWLAKINEQFQTCAQCSLEDARYEKKRPTPGTLK